jgi:hypothetical protein
MFRSNSFHETLCRVTRKHCQAWQRFFPPNCGFTACTEYYCIISIPPKNANTKLSNGGCPKTKISLSAENEYPPKVEYGFQPRWTYSSRFSSRLPHPVSDCYRYCADYWLSRTMWHTIILTSVADSTQCTDHIWLKWFLHEIRSTSTFWILPFVVSITTYNTLDTGLTCVSFAGPQLACLNEQTNITWNWPKVGNNFFPEIHHSEFLAAYSLTKNE